MLYAGRTWEDKPAFGWRDILEVYNDVDSPAPSNTSVYSSRTTSTGKSTRSKERFRLSPYRWLSYSEALQEARDLGSGLRELGAGNPTSGDFFAVYSVSS
jgi:long-chain acyl-CoA synthetase